MQRVGLVDIDHRILRQHVSDLREKSGGGNLEVLSDYGLFGDIQKMVRRNMQTMTDAGCGAQEMDVGTDLDTKGGTCQNTTGMGSDRRKTQEEGVAAFTAKVARKRRS